MIGGSVKPSGRRSWSKFRLPICTLLALAVVYILFFDSHHSIWIASSADNLSLWKQTHSSSDQPPPERPHTPADVHTAVHNPFHTTHLSHGSQCRGPRGIPLEDGITEDLPQRVVELRGRKYPDATYGSWSALGLERTWMTFEQRYGPYGFDDHDATYKFSHVNWSKVDWAALQDECAAAQGRAFFKGHFIGSREKPRIHFHLQGGKPLEPEGQTGRQAIVIRTWDDYEYTPEDFWNLRSIITEAALASRAEYTVYLLVHVRADDGAEIFHNTTLYHHILERSVPKEFRKIAVLFHQSLLENWYPKVEEYSSFRQIMQPLQLFRFFYPEFDHYWQFEMDTRFTGHAGKMLQAFHEFSKKQPYKQSRERASWTYIPRLHGSYDDFSASVNASLNGSATVWGPIPGLSAELLRPLRPVTPVTEAKDDLFEWGVGGDADLLLLDHLLDLDRFQSAEDFTFTKWFRGVDAKVPRFFSPGAQVRVSRALLFAVHEAQLESGIRLPSEVTMPTFALWHGLQIVQLPIPKFLFPEHDLRKLGYLQNGGNPADSLDGLANATGAYQRRLDSYARPSTYDFKSSLPDPTFVRWKEGGHFGPGDRELRKPEDMMPAAQMGEIPDGLPEFLKEVDGNVYAPNVILHPRKSIGRQKELD